MSKKKTHEEYVQELAIKNPNIKVVEQYVDCKTEIMHHCLIHSVDWKIKPSNVLHGQGCYLCRIEKISNSKTKTHSQYVEELRKVNPNIIVKEEYRGAKTSILHECTKHEIQWNVSPDDILHGHGCPKCKSEKISKNRLKSHEKYVKELKLKNSNIIPIENYIDANTSILHKCLIDGYTWKARPSNLLNERCGCPKCSQRFRRTNSDYIKEVLIKNPNIEPLEDFKGMTIPIMHRCKKHNIEWIAIPDNILRGCGCIECGREKISEKISKSRDEYIKEANLSKRNIKLIGTYVNASTPVLHKCLIDNYEWEVIPNSILNGTGCPKCAGKLKITNDIYINKLSAINQNITPLEDYVNMKTPILHICNIHDYKWMTTPSSTLQGCSCPICAKEKLSKIRKKTNEQYIEELKNKNPNIVPIENYINANTPILHKCLIDRHEWYAPPSRLLAGGGCPKCNLSKGEKQIAKWLHNNQINYEQQKRFNDCRDIKSLPFDFYLPDYNACIEYDGQQHFISIPYFGGDNGLKYRKKHDEIKNEYCKNNNIRILRISYNQNIEEELNNFLFI